MDIQIKVEKCILIHGVSQSQIDKLSDMFDNKSVDLGAVYKLIPNAKLAVDKEDYGQLAWLVNLQTDEMYKPDGCYSSRRY